jgi:hypothetical protein
MRFIKKLALVIGASTAGVFVGTVAATPFIALANYLATDGPIFPPPLVAFGLLALPVGFLLFLVQSVLVVVELTWKNLSPWNLLVLAAIAGTAVGLMWHLALDPHAANGLSWLALGAFGLIQALAVFGVHAFANLLRFAASRGATRL